MPERRAFVIDLYLSRRMATVLIAAVMALGVLGALLLARGSASAADRAAPAAAPAMRQYYLTTAAFPGSQAVGACAAGYHFASLWEIMQTATLSYNTTLGQTLDDSGQGPPSAHGGWVRTGWVSSSGTTVGEANCNNWTASTGYEGTMARPSNDWTSAEATFQGWVVQTEDCGPGWPVWCVEDMAAAPSPTLTATPAATASPTSSPTRAPGREVYLPLVLR